MRVMNDFSETVRCEELNDMKKDPKEQAIVEWLQKVDRPVGKKEESKKDKRSRDK